jgi:membrane protease YdiL (CAAX protease family)
MSWLKRHDVALYLLLAFALAWLPWPGAIGNPNPDTALMIPWSPVIAALIVLGLSLSRKGVAELLRAIVRWRYGVRWYLLALLAPVAVTLGGVYLNSTLGAPAPMLPTLKEVPQILLAFVVLMIIQGPLTEEPGWRGYLLPRLLSDRSPIVASLIVGVIWASWHLPLLISDPSAQRPPLQYFVAVISMSIVFSWLHIATRGGLLLVILMHTANNTIAAAFLARQPGEYYGRIWWLYAAIWLIFALVVMRSSVMSVARAPKAVEVAEALAVRPGADIRFRRDGSRPHSLRRAD